MNKKHNFSLFFAIVILVAVVFSGCQQNVNTSRNSGAAAALTTLSAEDVSLLVKNFPAESLRQFADNPAQKNALLQDLKTLLAIAAEARRNNVAEEPDIKEQLNFITSSVVATEFDRQNRSAESKDLPTAPFADIKPEEVEAFYKDAGNEAKYNAFVGLMKKRAASRPGGAPDFTEPQLQQLRDAFAKVFITERKAREAGFDKKRETQLAVSLQHATFLAQEYGRRVDEQFKVSDEEVTNYIKEHPELDSSKKREQAEQVLQRAKSGEDFAKLAKEFSEDPGSKDKGGLYENIKKGQFVPEFETVAFGLEKSQIADKLVESKFGYHIIKLENKTDDSFTARHILFMTTAAPDAANPFAPPQSMNEKARADIKKQKRDRWLEEIVAKNEIKLPSAEEVKIEAPPATPAAAVPPATAAPETQPATSPAVEGKKPNKQ